jgi:hypothetical protein
MTAHPVTSDPALVPARLELLEASLAAHGFPVADLRPGLSREQIARQVEGLDFDLPEELYQLYMWHNGSGDDSDLLLFRDQQFSPLEVGIGNVAPLATYYGVSGAFPFAELEGSWFVLPAEPFSVDSRFERPVVSVFEGVDVFFHSFVTMLDTVRAWIDDGVHRPGGVVDADRELVIWREHNPGIFAS